MTIEEILRDMKAGVRFCYTEIEDYGDDDIETLDVVLEKMPNGLWRGGYFSKELNSSDMASIIWIVTRDRTYSETKYTNVRFENN